MDIVRLAISKPVGVTVGVLLVVMFGLIGLGAIPIQLTPTVDTPLVTVSTAWPGRSPQEIVEEITKEQEERLKNVANLRTMTSTSNEGNASIVLEFELGSDITRALQEVSDALRQVPDYPEDANEPTIQAAGAGPENAIAWIIIDLDPAFADQYPDFDITTIYNALDKEMKPFLERIDGVAEVNIYGGREQEVRVMVDQEALAQRALTHADVVGALRGENQNVSAGSIAEGKRDYRVRVVGQFKTEEDVLSTIVAYRDSGPVYVRDVAEVEIGYQKKRGFVRSLGYPSIAVNAIRQTGANVVDVMDELRNRLEVVKSDVLPNLAGEVGPHLRLRQVYDETVYIESSIGLVTQNLYVGGALAAIVLLVFLRSITSTGIIAIAIPVSALGTFLVMLALGRTLNVISLAGLAFAVGMVVDNAIVVLENIYRHVQMGKKPMEAAYEGGREVWGAILASTLTTVAVFVPVLTIQEEAGQLFRDIAIAIVAAVSLSLIVSIVVIPSAASRWLKPRAQGANVSGWRSLFGIAPLLAREVDRLGGIIAWCCSGWRASTVRPGVILVMTIASLGGAALLAPPLDYLPAGNRNLVFGGLLIPPGLSVQKQREIAEIVEQRVGPYMQSTDEEVASLPPIPMGFAPDSPAFEPQRIENFFVGAFDGGMFCGATSGNDQVVIPIGQLLTNSMNGIPDTFGGAQQSSLFGRGIGGGNTVDVQISGPDLSRVVQVANAVVFQLANNPIYGWGRVRPNPSNFNLSQPEYRVELNETARELGFSTLAVGNAVRGLFDGAFVDDFVHEGDTIDMVVLPADGKLEDAEQLAYVPVATPLGPTVPLDSIVDITAQEGPQTIQRIEELPSVTVAVTPPPGMPVGQVLRDIEESVIGPARASGLIDRSMRIRMEGTAAKLDEVQASLFGAAPAADTPPGAGQRALNLFSWILIAAGVGCAGWCFVRAAGKSDRRTGVYAAIGSVMLAVILAGIFLGLSSNPNLATARFIWAIAVTYLLMCALFESFLYPLVIMFSVPLAVVGGFAGLAIVHQVSVMDPTIAPQNLDVLTMLGFVILIGVVVNNAILLVHQALNSMRGIDEDGNRTEALGPVEAIAASVRTRVRPIFMSTLTSVGGMMPLVLFPGAGSEMYRGLGSVVIGGLLVSTVFTLLLVPLVFSLVMDIARAMREVIGRREAGVAVPIRGTA